MSIEIESLDWPGLTTFALDGLGQIGIVYPAPLPRTTKELADDMVKGLRSDQRRQFESFFATVRPADKVVDLVETTAEMAADARKRWEEKANEIEGDFARALGPLTVLGISRLTRRQMKGAFGKFVNSWRVHLEDIRQRIDLRSGPKEQLIQHLKTKGVSKEAMVEAKRQAASYTDLINAMNTFAERQVKTLEEFQEKFESEIGITGFFNDLTRGIILLIELIFKLLGEFLRALISHLPGLVIAIPWWAWLGGGLYVAYRLGWLRKLRRKGSLSGDIAGDVVEIDLFGQWVPCRVESGGESCTLLVDTPHRSRGASLTLLGRRRRKFRLSSLEGDIWGGKKRLRRDDDFGEFSGDIKRCVQYGVTPRNVVRCVTYEAGPNGPDERARAAAGILSPYRYSTARAMTRGKRVVAGPVRRYARVWFGVGPRALPAGLRIPIVPRFVRRAA